MNKKEIEEFAVMKTDIGHIKESLVTNTEQHKELKDMISKFIDGADKKYAPQYTTALAIGSFLTALGIIVTLIV